MKRYILALPIICLTVIVTAQENQVISLSDSSGVPEKIYIPRPRVADITAQQTAIFHNNYYETLGAACKAELKIEKATKVPFRFRLGSLQQTDYLEQKPNAIKPERQ